LQSFIEIKYIFKMNLTTNQITFLRHVPSDIKVDMRTGWRHHYFDGFSIGEVFSFINSIKDDNIYLLIPLFSSSQSLQIATLNLSEPFLVNNQSNPALMANFILDQWNSSGFNIKQDTSITFAFKWKRVWISDI
jgi:hypothetical protein